MPYNLASIATRAKPFRTIAPSAVQEGELLRIYTPILTRWRNSAATRMAIYATADIAAMQEDDDNTAKEVAALLALMRFRTFFTKVEVWHRAKWLASVKAASGVDATWMTPAPMAMAVTGRVMAQQATGGVVAAARGGAGAGEGYTPVAPSPRGVLGFEGSIEYPDPSMGTITDAVDQAIASAKVQAKSLSDEAQNRINQAILAGKRSGMVATEVARNINVALTKVRKRALGIVDNELDNAIKTFTKARMAEAGLDWGRWDHLAGQRNPRPEHQARDRKLYRAGDPILAEMLLPNCHCVFSPVLRLGKFSGV